MVLDADLTSFSGESLHKALLMALERGKPVHFDGSQVQRVDLACLQLLVAFRRAAMERGILVSWSKCSSPLLYAVRITGLSSVLEM